MPLRGNFPGSPNIIAWFVEASGGGDIWDINAPRNAPAKNPHLHLDKVGWHIDFEQFQVLSETTVTVNHTALAGRKARTGFQSGLRLQDDTSDPAPPPPWSPQPGGAWIVNYGTQRVTNILLVSHGLGYRPLYFVAHAGAMLVNGRIVQDQGGGRLRSVSAYATTTGIYLREIADSSDVQLDAISLNYSVLVVESPPVNPALPLWSGSPSAMQMGRGRLNLLKKVLRRTLAGESDYDFDLGRAIDLKNGGYRVVTGGNVFSTQFYNGAFAGPSYIPVGV